MMWTELSCATHCEHRDYMQPRARPMPVFAAGCCILVCWLALAARALGSMVLHEDGGARGVHWFSHVCGSQGRRC